MNLVILHTISPFTELAVKGYMLLLFSSLICLKLKRTSVEGKIHILPENLFEYTDIKIMTNTHKPYNYIILY